MCKRTGAARQLFGYEQVAKRIAKIRFDFTGKFNEVSCKSKNSTFLIKAEFSIEYAQITAPSLLNLSGYL